MKPSCSDWGFVCGLLLAGPVNAVEWTQYRGPNHDGSSPETLRTNWTTSPPKLVWRKSIGPGWSDVTVAGGRVFTMLARSASGMVYEYAAAYDAKDGRELWLVPVELADYDSLAGYDDRYDGPRSTPTVDGGHVFFFSGHLKLQCLRTDTGASVWKRDFVQEFNAAVIPWQNAASPLVVGDRLFVNGNGGSKHLMALDKATGKTLWAVESDGLSHATPVYATLGDVPQVIFLTMGGLVGLAPDSGSVLWRYGFSPSSTSTASSPVVVGDAVFASCAYGRGAWNARVTKPGASFVVSDTEFVSGTSYENHWATPVAHNGLLYCIVERSSRSLACYDPVARLNRWTTSKVGSGNPGFASLIKVGGVLVVLTEPGELVLVDPNPDAYVEIARFQALQSHCWNHPVMSNGRLYLRGSSNLDQRDQGYSQLAVFDVAPPVLPLPPLRLAAELQSDGSSVLLTISAADGSGLDASAADRLEVQSVQTLADAAPPWSPLAVTLQFDQGKLSTTVPIIPANPAQFLRTHEKSANP